MAQTGFTPISIYYSSTAAATPTAGNLVAGELAINTADGKLFYKDSSGTVQVIGTKGGVGSSTTTQVLYNSSGLVVGSANMTFNGTTLTLANDASISGLTVGKGGGAISDNTAFGVQALVSNTTGATNTVVGGFASWSNTTGSENTFIGRNTAYYNTTGSQNTAVGRSALQSNTTASENTAVGYQALYVNTTAARNTAIGYQAGAANTTGHITAVGAYALRLNTTGASNVAVGGNDESFAAALQSNTTGSYNVAVGTGALKDNTTASNNTAVGYQAGYSTTTGINNFYAGYQAGYTATTTGGNVAIGYQAGYSNQTNAGVFIGPNAGRANTTGTANTFVGASGSSFVGYANTTGAYNTAFGADALAANTTADNNTAVGYQAGLGTTTGGTNVFLGRLAGSNTTTGFSNTYIGNNAQGSAVGNNNEIVIGNSATGKGSATGYIYPNGGGVYQGNNSATWSITSDARLKKNIVDNNTGLSVINAIQVRNFEYRLPEEVIELEPTCAIERTGVQLGVIAQEIAQVSQEFVKTESTGVMSVDTDNLVWYLINAVKELKAEIDQLKGK